MGWISKRHMRSGGSIGGRSGPHKGPLRKIVEWKRINHRLFEVSRVVMECGHEGPCYDVNAKRARCAKCGRGARAGEGG
jgi:ribosomal protein S27E